MKRAVLLVALGAPESIEEVAPFLTAVRHGRPSPPELVREFEHRYRQIGGGSPLPRWSRAQAEGVERTLRDAAVDWPCRYAALWGAPTIFEVWRELLAAGIERIRCIPLTPYYSGWGVGAYFRAVRAVARRERPPSAVEFVTDWHRSSGLHRVFARRIAATLSQVKRRYREAPRVVYTAHSLPDRPDPGTQAYRRAVQETAAAVRALLPPVDSTLAYQSVGRAEGPWLGPSVERVVDALQRERPGPIVLAPIGFLADNLEILYDLDEQLVRRRSEEGSPIIRAPVPNADTDLLQALAHVAVDESDTALPRGLPAEPDPTSARPTARKEPCFTAPKES